MQIPTLLSCALLVLVAGCRGTYRTYPLDIRGAEAPGYFQPLLACAGERSFAATSQKDAVNVAVDGASRLNFLVSGDVFKLVVVFDDSVSLEERAGKIDSMRRTGDELLACARARGPSEPPPVAGTALIAPPARLSLEVPAVPACAREPKACEDSSACDYANGERCNEGRCTGGGAGCPCAGLADCGRDAHCADGVCHPNIAGTRCEGTGKGPCGDGALHCAAGQCFPGTSGYPCNGPLECVASCRDGVCL